MQVSREELLRLVGAEVSLSTFEQNMYRDIQELEAYLRDANYAGRDQTDEIEESFWEQYLDKKTSELDRKYCEYVGQTVLFSGRGTTPCDLDGSGEKVMVSGVPFENEAMSANGFEVYIDPNTGVARVGETFSYVSPPDVKARLGGYVVTAETLKVFSLPGDFEVDTGRPRQHTESSLYLAIPELMQVLDDAQTNARSRVDFLSLLQNIEMSRDDMEFIGQDTVHQLVSVIFQRTGIGGDIARVTHAERVYKDIGRYAARSIMIADNLTLGDHLKIRRGRCSYGRGDIHLMLEGRILSDSLQNPPGSQIRLCMGDLVNWESAQDLVSDDPEQ